MRLGLARTVFAGLLVATTVMMLLPREELSSHAPNDKVSHLVTFVVLALAGRWARVPWVALAIGLAAYAAATEVLQAVLPVNRHGDVRDLLADLVGLLLGLALGPLLARRRRDPDRGVLRTRG